MNWGANQPIPQRSLLRRMWDHRDANRAILLARDRQRHPIEGHRPFFYAIFSQGIGDTHPKIAPALPVDGPGNLTDPVNVALDNMAPQRLARPKCPFQIEFLTGLGAAQPGAIQRFLSQKELGDTGFLGHNGAACPGQGNGIANTERTRERRYIDEQT